MVASYGLLVAASPLARGLGGGDQLGEPAAGQARPVVEHHRRQFFWLKNDKVDEETCVRCCATRAGLVRLTTSLKNRVLADRGVRVEQRL